MLAIVFCMAVFEPWPISVMAITAPTPMITPRAVRAERILFRRKAPRAVRNVGGSSEPASTPRRGFGRRRRRGLPAACRPTGRRATAAASLRRRPPAAIGHRLSPARRRPTPSPLRRTSPLPSADAVARPVGRRDASARPPHRRAASGSWRLVALDQAVDDADRAMGVGGHLGIVRHQDDGDPLGVELLEHPQDFHAGVRIEVAGRLVGQQQRGAIDQRPGDGHPLLLAAGHLRRLVVGAVGQPDAVQQRLRPAPGLGAGQAAAASSPAA